MVFLLKGCRCLVCMQHLVLDSCFDVLPLSSQWCIWQNWVKAVHWWCWLNAIICANSMQYNFISWSFFRICWRCRIFLKAMFDEMKIFSLLGCWQEVHDTVPWWLQNILANRIPFKIFPCKWIIQAMFHKVYVCRLDNCGWYSYWRISMFVIVRYWCKDKKLVFGWQCIEWTYMSKCSEVFWIFSIIFLYMYC